MGCKLKTVSRKELKYFIYWVYSTVAFLQLKPKEIITENRIIVIMFYSVCSFCQFSRVTLCSNPAQRTHIIMYFISFTRSKVYIFWVCFHLIMLGNDLGQGSYLQSREWLQTISQAASSQRSPADNMKDITLYITTLGSHKHNKSRAKSIKHGEKMEEGKEEQRSECKEGSHGVPVRRGGNMARQ